jgi:hypothetical protein
VLQKRGKKLCLGEAHRKQQTTDYKQVRGCSVPKGFSHENNRSQEQQHQRDSSMKPAEFRFDPRVQVALQKATFVGVGTVILE